jgi:hypothetical protein
MCIVCNIYKQKYNKPKHTFNLKDLNDLKSDYIYILKKNINKDNISDIEKKYCQMLINIINISEINLIENDIEFFKNDFLFILDKFVDCKKK